jgi:hypothetical protein
MTQAEKQAAVDHILKHCNGITYNALAYLKDDNTTRLSEIKNCTVHMGSELDKLIFGLSSEERLQLDDRG